MVRGTDRAGRRGQFVIDARSGAVLDTVLLNQGAPEYGPMEWGPDNDAVLFEHASRGIVKHRLTDGQEQIIYPYAAEGAIKRIHRFGMSPDGQRLAFSAFDRDDVSNVLHMVDATGDRELARRTFPELMVFQGWSSDSEAVLFTMLQTTNTYIPHQLWRVPAWGGAPVQIDITIPGATQINPMAFSPSGSALAYTAGTPQSELWVMENFLPR